MSTDRDVTRIVRSWLSEDRHEDANPVLNTVLDQLDTTPQRRTLWSARRFTNMNNALRIGLAAAAVVIIAVIAINLLPGTPMPGGGASPSPSGPAEPSSEPSSTPEYLLSEGPHVLAEGQHEDFGETVPITVTIPAPGWYGDTGGLLIVKDNNPNPPSGAIYAFPVVDGLYVYGDPCQWSTTRPESPATTADAFLTAIAAQPSRDASAPVDISLDGYAGVSITLHVPDDANPVGCDQGLYGSWAVGTNEVPDRYHQGPGQIDKLWILDVDGALVVIDAWYYAETPQALLDEIEAIVSSTTFE